jgi:HlyD family secretion protein
MGRERGQGEGGARQSTRGRIYVLAADNKPIAHAVRLGITDGVSTELLVRPGDETLKEGANVITGVLGAAAGAGGAAASPRQAGGPRPPF